jgi:hypothetical protein
VDKIRRSSAAAIAAQDPNHDAAIWTPTLARLQLERWAAFVCPCVVLLFWSATSPRLLLADACDLFDDLVVDVRIGGDQAASRIGVAQQHLDGLFVVGDFCLREIAHEDRLARHGVRSFRRSGRGNA